ncbi:cyclin-dependent serine/threonine protein kinase [Pichia kluyveri]|uniref:Cyclin-dependent kinase 8 n=1 Tax=Pichia kluyveri TaxID=36015 RepID=A0AAV5RA48_PICKL|nr:cyclin-dependent serine/threonine protein kinase [Pichia kluyveri]
MSNPQYWNGQQPGRMAPNNFFSLEPYRQRKDASRVSIIEKYDVLGYIAAGTYGKVYKAVGKQHANLNQLYAIKKFKSDSKDNQVLHYTGISQSAIREMSLCKEINHQNISTLKEIILENKSIYMVFEFAEYDLLQIIHYHSHPEIKPINKSSLKSIMFQILQGLTFLHENWILHRDLKPANIMVTQNGVIKIGDLGLARRFNNQLQTLYTGDKVVVTIWYRAPELLLGARHYTPAVDLWAVGCILAELLSLRPLFKGEETKMDNKKHMPFQENQLLKIMQILGTPTVNEWPTLNKYPEYHQLQRFTMFPSNLKAWYTNNGGVDEDCLDFLSKLLIYDPNVRINSLNSMSHEWFKQDPLPVSNIFANSTMKYPKRRIHKGDNDILGPVNNNNNNNNNNIYSNKRKTNLNNIQPNLNMGMNMNINMNDLTSSQKRNFASFMNNSSNIGFENAKRRN